MSLPWGPELKDLPREPESYPWWMYALAVLWIVLIIWGGGNTIH